MRYGLCLLLLAAAAGAQEDSWRRIAGDSSAIRETRVVAVSDKEAWKKLWAEHERGAPRPKPAPKVDFDKEMVAAVFLGERPSNGYSVSLELKPSGSLPAKLAILYREQKPSGDFQNQVRTQPFAMVKVPKSYASVDFAAAPADGPESVPSMAEPARQVSRVADKMRDAVASAKLPALFDGSKPASAVEAGTLQLAAQLPPPPGSGGGGSQLPPPPGRGGRGGGGQLPPPPGSGAGGGQPLPPPPGGGGGGQPLPPPPVRHPQPGWDGQLPRNDDRLRDADRTFDTSGMKYVGYWKKARSYERDTGVVETSPKDGDVKYILNLTSPQYENYTRFYYNPQDRQYYWAPDRERVLFGGESRRLEVEFVNRDKKPLLPWEKESFSFTLEGGDVGLASANGAYKYDTDFTVNPRQPEKVIVRMTAGAKRLMPPDSDGVSAQIEATAAGLKLVIKDKWAQHYAGENLEIQLMVSKDSGSIFRRDPVVREYTARAPLIIPATETTEIDIPAGRGTYYIRSWSFRRARSKVSAGDWVLKGEGNVINK